MSSYSEYIREFEESFKPSDYIDYDRLKQNNPESVCTIRTYLGKTETQYIEKYGSLPSIDGILDSTSLIGLQGVARYQDYMSNLNIFRELQQYLGMMGSLGGGKVPQVSLQSLRLSEQNYMGSEVKVPSGLKLSVPIIAKKDDPWKIASNLLSYVIGVRPNAQPIPQGGWGEKLKAFGANTMNEFVLFAPNNYSVKWVNGDKILGGSDDYPQNAVEVLIGTRFWFRPVLLTDVSCSFSNNIYVDGKCTNLDITFSFKPWRTPDVNEVRSWFSNGR